MLNGIPAVQHFTKVIVMIHAWMQERIATSMIFKQNACG